LRSTFDQAGTLVRGILIALLASRKRDFPEVRACGLMEHC
jgi:hypothetical protein